MRVLIVAAAVALAACPPPKNVERGYAAPSPAELAQAVRARAAKMPMMQAEARVDTMGPKAEQRVKVSMNFLTAPGGKLRVEVEAAMGALLSFASDGKEFGLSDIRSSVHLHGPADRCAVARVLQVELAPEAVANVLTGSAPLDGEPAAVSWDAAGREVLELKSPDGGREIVKLDAAQHRWDVLSAERVDASGQVLWRVVHEGFHDEKGGIRLPERTTIEQPPTKSDARMRFLKRDLSPSPPAGIFRLTPPKGFQDRYVDCTTG